jgi:hypothetical protein
MTLIWGALAKRVSGLILQYSDLDDKRVERRRARCSESTIPGPPLAQR